ncbi:MAG: hypothetical protein ACOYK9_01405 [Chlamydiia bacterium]
MLRYLLVFLLPFCSLFAASKEITIPLHVYLNGVDLGVHAIAYDLQGSLNLDSPGFRNAVYPYLNQVGVGEMNEYLYGQGSIFTGLDEDGEGTPLDEDMSEIVVDYEDSAKVLYVWVPDPYLNQTFLDKKAEEPNVPIVRSSPISGYLNVTYGHKIFHKYYKELKIPHNQNFANLDLSLNVHDYVFQGFAYAAATQPGIINRGNLILTKDFVEMKARLAIGDQGSYSFGLQNSIPLLGVSLSKGMNVFVNPTIASASRNEFFLNAATKVEVYVDGVLYQTMELPAGPHLLQNFPIIQGLNNVRLKIVNPMGLEQTISLNSFYEPNLLPSKELEYFLTFGFPNYSESGFNYNYQFYRPTLMSAVRYGFFNNFTLGAYLQGNSTGAYFGGQAVYEYSWIRTLFDLGFSALPDSSVQSKARLAFSKGLLAAAPKLSFDYEFAVEASEKRFSYLQAPIKYNPTYLSFAGKLAKKLPWGIKSSVTGNYNFDEKSKDAYKVQLKLEKTFLESFLARFLLVFKGKNKRPEGVSNWDNDYSFAFGIDFVPKETGFKVITDYNDELQAFNANAKYSTPCHGDSKIDLNAGGSFLQKGASGTGFLNYSGQRFTAGISQYLANGPLSFNVPDFPTNLYSSLAVTQINAGTALVYAGGQFAISRPIEDSFALVMSKKNNQAQHLRAYKENFKKRYNETLFSMPAVVPSLKSYKETDIHVDVYKKGSWDVEQSEHVKVRPGYRSGTCIQPKKVILRTSSKSRKNS